MAKSKVLFVLASPQGRRTKYSSYLLPRRTGEQSTARTCFPGGQENEVQSVHAPLEDWRTKYRLYMLLALMRERNLRYRSFSQ